MMHRRLVGLREQEHVKQRKAQRLLEEIGVRQEQWNRVAAESEMEQRDAYAELGKRARFHDAQRSKQRKLLADRRNVIKANEERAKLSQQKSRKKLDLKLNKMGELSGEQETQLRMQADAAPASRQVSEAHAKKSKNQILRMKEAFNQVEAMTGATDLDEVRSRAISP